MCIINFLNLCLGLLFKPVLYNMFCTESQAEDASLLLNKQNILGEQVSTSGIPPEK